MLNIILEYEWTKVQLKKMALKGVIIGKTFVQIIAVGIVTVAFLTASYQLMKDNPNAAMSIINTLILVLVLYIGIMYVMLPFLKRRRF